MYWNPDEAQLNRSLLEGLDAAIHLSGENVAARRWSVSQKREILSSRTDSTRLLAETLSTLSTPPKTFISASAIGFYGPNPTGTVDESSAQGPGFLAEVCRQWEEAADPARQAGIRVVHPRFGVIVSLRGGAVAKMLPAFKFGIGGKIGDGKRRMSWIALCDAAESILQLIDASEVSGPVNIVSPNVVTNEEFTKALAAAVHRPALFPIPPIALRIAFGEMADETILSSAHVRPKVLESVGYRYRYPTIAEALRA